LLPKHTQFKNSYIYSFNWEDPRVDERLLKINSEDTILTITSAGDNILSYILDASPKRIHAVDLNPAQNHLLELKLAAFTVLEHHDIWKIFGSGHHEWFRAILITKLSPYLSSQAFQFWLDNARVFTSSGGLYESGHSGVAIKTTKWLFRIFRLNSAVTKLCNAQTLNEQREIWRETVRPVMLSKWVSRGIIGNESFLWKALGVPPNQRDMIVNDYLERNRGKGDSRMAMWEYVVNTLDPVIENSMIGEENYFYLLCLKGSYTKR
jgi:betaine lipid synthase